MDKVAPEPNTGCWLWLGALSAKGYARFHDRSYIVVWAHRWAYVHFRGRIPKGKHLDHLCRVPSCVNPDHLEPVTVKENNRRKDRYWRKEKRRIDKQSAIQ